MGRYSLPHSVRNLYLWVITRQSALCGANSGDREVAHAVQAVRYRLWYLIFTACLCGVLELLGWSGRLWSSWDPFLDTPFKME